LGAFFKACKGGSTSEAGWADKGASPSPDTVTPEKPVVARAAKPARASHRDYYGKYRMPGNCSFQQEANTDVAPRLEWEISDMVGYAFT
jgi:hypothetical protein